MTATLVHRGPNDSGFWHEDSVAIGFRRLSIIDLSPRASQPMVSADGSHVIAFNGEIFNYVELRKELCALGHRMQTTSDTEVLLASWRQWGDACVDRLEGMFAFVIWDRTRGELFGARDRFGIKPLYVYEAADAVLFASEIKAIEASGLYERRENWSVIARYLLDGCLDETSATCFAGIHQIPPAHAFRVGLRGRLRQYRYFELPTDLDERATECPRRVADMLEESARTRMRSDVPLGVCLSGGIDSTAIICAMARHRQATNDASPLLAFNYNPPEFDESRYIDATVRQTGATLVSWDGNVRDLWSNLSRVLHFHDEPLHAMNALIGYELMGMARKNGAIVVLNGQGADEVLGGYSSYYDDYWSTLMVSGRFRDAWSEMSKFALTLGANVGQLAARVLRRLALRSMRRIGAYEAAARVARTRASHSHPWFSADLASKSLERRSYVGIGLDAAQRHAVTTASLPLYLRIEDRNSMAHGVEARLPFLDHRLVSYALTLPVHWRIRGAWNKYALREASSGRIPEMVRTRVDKMGFPTPTARWFGGELHEPLRDILGSSAARERGLYRTENMLRELDAGRGGEVREDAPLFRAANVEVWLSMLKNRDAARSASN
jgi:asparagine synthase (glutamine-hydrolysing)